MGFRTVVMLNNDATHEWSKDPALGQKIHHDMSIGFTISGRGDQLGRYGSVVECVHADTQTLVALEHYSSFTPLAYTAWRPNQENRDLELIKQAADALGYRLVKKPEKKP